MINIKEITFLNEIGQRPQLEDSIYPPAGGATYSDKLFLVCDGVGGESMGEEASRIACEEFAAFFHQNPPGGGKPDAAYINQVQKQVLQKMALFVGRHPEAARMSTTLTLVYLDDEGISVAWCGDSRIYHLRDGGVHWRSTDHSLVASLVKHGEISEEEARKHPQRNVITRSLSAGASAFPIDTYYINDVRDGDYLMLCTDGVLEQITEQKLGGILNNPHDKRALFLTYCGGKTKDNFSLYLLGLQSDSQPVMKKAVKPIVPVMLVLIIALAVLGTVFMTPIKKFFSPDNKPHPAKPKETIHAAAPIPTVQHPVTPPPPADSNQDGGKPKTPPNGKKSAAEKASGHTPASAAPNTAGGSTGITGKDTSKSRHRYHLSVVLAASVKLTKAKAADTTGNK